MFIHKKSSNLREYNRRKARINNVITPKTVIEETKEETVAENESSPVIKSKVRKSNPHNNNNETENNTGGNDNVD